MEHSVGFKYHENTRSQCVECRMGIAWVSRGVGGRTFDTRVTAASRGRELGGDSRIGRDREGQAG